MKKAVNILIFLFLLYPAFSQDNSISSALKNAVKKDQTSIVLELPSELKQPDEELIQHRVFNNRIQGTYWNVYIVNNGRFTYFNEKKYKMNFLSQFYASHETSDSLFLLQDPKLREENKVSLFAMKYGWILKNDLLLSEHCLVNNNNSPIYGIVSSECSNEKSNYFYLDSDLKQQSNKQISANSLMYVYKKTQNSLLLGTKESFIDQGSIVKNVILGWISKDKFIRLSGSFFLEPNWEISAVKKRLNNNVKASLYDENGNLIWNDDSYNIRKTENFFRFIIKDTIDNKIKIQKIDFTEDGSKNLIKNGFIKYNTSLHFKTVKLVSAQELTKMIMFTHDIYEILLSTNKTRIKLFNFLNEYGESTLGKSIEKFCGHSNNNTFYYKTNISDFKYSSNITPEFLSNLKNVFYERYKYLNEVYNTLGYPFSYKSDNNFFYWIDLENIP